MHVLQKDSGLIHRPDCSVATTATPGKKGWVEVPETIAPLLAARLAPAWKPSWKRGSLGCCEVCKPEGV